MFRLCVNQWLEKANLQSRQGKNTHLASISLQYLLSIIAKHNNYVDENLGHSTVARSERHETCHWMHSSDSRWIYSRLPPWPHCLHCGSRSRQGSALPSQETSLSNPLLLYLCILFPCGELYSSLSRGIYETSSVEVTLASATRVEVSFEILTGSCFCYLMRVVVARNVGTHCTHTHIQSKKSPFPPP